MLGVSLETASDEAARLRRRAEEAIPFAARPNCLQEHVELVNLSQDLSKHLGSVSRSV